MMRKDFLAPGAEGNDVERLCWLAWHFHARRTNRHSGNSKPFHALRPLRKETFHVGYGHMSLEDHAVDDRRMA